MKKNMKKIESYISDEKSKQIDEICNKEGYTRAEFNRRALELYLDTLQGISTTTTINVNDIIKNLSPHRREKIERRAKKLIEQEITK